MKCRSRTHQGIARTNQFLNNTLSLMKNLIVRSLTCQIDWETTEMYLFCEPSFCSQQETGGGISKDIKKRQAENMQCSKQSLQCSLVVQQHRHPSSTPICRLQSALILTSCPSTFWPSFSKIRRVPEDAYAHQWVNCLTFSAMLLSIRVFQYWDLVKWSQTFPVALLRGRQVKRSSEVFTQCKISKQNG